VVCQTGIILVEQLPQPFLNAGRSVFAQEFEHRRRYVRRKPVTRRPSMLDPHISLIEEWLAAAPHLSAVDILPNSPHWIALTTRRASATRAPDVPGKSRPGSKDSIATIHRKRGGHAPGRIEERTGARHSPKERMPRR
jgi:hypothetical protein